MDTVNFALDLPFSLWLLREIKCSTLELVIVKAKLNKVNLSIFIFNNYWKDLYSKARCVRKIQISTLWRFGPFFFFGHICINEQAVAIFSHCWRNWKKTKNGRTEWTEDSQAAEIL